VEVYSQQLLEIGQAPLPRFAEPALDPYSGAGAAERFPLVLTCGKATMFCHSQHRNLPRLRRAMPDPAIELHPDAARHRDIGEGDWIAVETPHGRFRGRARLRGGIDERVVVAQHGWWQACLELHLPGYDPVGPDTANFNAAIRADVTDPVSGVPGHRSYLCEVRRLPR
jgi:anaerobic selenocysteine-containing dehydrogenase